MTALNQTVQNLGANPGANASIPTRYEVYAPGQIASSMPYKIVSGRYVDSSTNNNHPLKFGYGCGYDGEGAITQNIVRSHPVFKVPTGNLSDSATSIGFDPDSTSTDVGNPDIVRAGDFIQIDNEIMYVSGVGASALTIVRGQKGTSGASHTAGTNVYNLNGTNTFAGVALRDQTIAGRFNSSEVDAFIEGEIVPVLMDGDAVCVFYERILPADVGSPVSVIGDGSSAGLFRKGTDDEHTFTVPRARIVAAESGGTELAVGSDTRYLAVVRFTG